MRTLLLSFSIPSHSTPLSPTASFSLPISCALFPKPLGLFCAASICVNVRQFTGTRVIYEDLHTPRKLTPPYPVAIYC